MGLFNSKQDDYIPPKEFKGMKLDKEGNIIRDTARDNIQRIQNLSTKKSPKNTRKRKSPKTRKRKSPK